MCGIAGFRQLKSCGSNDAIACLRAMGDTIRHRGPDADGYWHEASLNLGFVHRRLSIQDISPSGAQPMTSASGRYVIAFNGEIYNFLDLREELSALGHSFRGHSDTEVMLGCFEQWGLDASLEKFEGMFAFALFDVGHKRLYLARDRMGEKPLYYGWNRHSTFLFGSELKALRRHPDFDGEIDRDAITLLLKYNYIPAPYSIYKTIRKLEPGCYITVDMASVDRKAETLRYWDISSCYRHELAGADRQEYTLELERLLMRSVRQQMISDVPLGAFLSGGIDSSTVVALMQSASSSPVKTFCIGFNEKRYNEAVYAKEIARHLGTDHTELYIDADDTLEVIPLLPGIYDEPFADSSQIPTYIISRLAAGEVTVSLSGDGGDELFCGYDRYFDCHRYWQSLKHGPGPKHALATALLRTVPDALLARLIRQLLPSQRGYSPAHIREKIARHLDINDSASLREYYEKSIRFWYDPVPVARGSTPTSSLLADYDVSAAAGDDYRIMMLLDSISYLPDDILVKVDRAAMANSLETRVPFLNHTVVEYAARIPSRMQTDGITGKHLLRDILRRHVPESLTDRPKQGFAVPLETWLRTRLRDWTRDLLDRDRIRREGYFDEQSITRKLDEHLSGSADHSSLLWSVISFQAWLEGKDDSYKQPEPIPQSHRSAGAGAMSANTATGGQA